MFINTTFSSFLASAALGEAVWLQENDEDARSVREVMISKKKCIEANNNKKVLKFHEEYENLCFGDGVSWSN